jgi:hypothetical protein
MQMSCLLGDIGDHKKEMKEAEGERRECQRTME